MRRLGVVLFAFVLAAAAIQVPACEYNPTSGPQPAGTLQGELVPAAPQPLG